MYCMCNRFYVCVFIGSLLAAHARIVNKMASSVCRKTKSGLFGRQTTGSLFHIDLSSKTKPYSFDEHTTANR